MIVPFVNNIVNKLRNNSPEFPKFKKSPKRAKSPKSKKSPKRAKNKK